MTVMQKQPTQQPQRQIQQSQHPATQNRSLFHKQTHTHTLTYNIRDETMNCYQQQQQQEKTIVLTFNV